MSKTKPIEETKFDQNVDMPECSTPPILEFKQHRKALRQCLIIYGDFECLTEKLPANLNQTAEQSYTQKLEHHTPCGFASQAIF